MSSGEHSRLHWETPAQFMKELKKLGLKVDEAASLARVMDRFAGGRTFRRDHKVLRDGVEELRIDGDRRTFRVYFTRVGDGELVLLCLHAHSKKKDNDRDAVDLALQRRRKHLDGQWP
jgi:putative component of toxin-antitoxin plasmid stabilization module